MVNSRFGPLSLDPKKSILFPRGIIGYPDLSYCLLPRVQDYYGYLLLQSMEDDDLCFIVRPLILEEALTEQQLIEPCDTAAMMERYHMEYDRGIVFLMTCTYTKNGEKMVSFNLKAPLIVDTSRRLGYQHIFENRDYSIRHERPLDVFYQEA